MSNANMDLGSFEPYEPRLKINYSIPDVEPDAETDLSVWPYYANGALIGRIVETERGYVGTRVAPVSEREFWRGPERSFREQAIGDVVRHFETTHND